jgi:hypothetical protein
MDGLLVQKALVDHPAIAERTHAVILFGTPTGGLLKARSLRVVSSGAAAPCLLRDRGLRQSDRRPIPNLGAKRSL